MQKSFYFLSPVEVVKVTSQNMQEVAEWCGGKIAATESRRVPGRMDNYVWVPTPKGTSISWAFPGMYITKRLVRNVNDEIKATYAVFRKDYFDKNYFDSPEQAVNETWERYYKSQESAPADSRPEVKNHPVPQAPKKIENVKPYEVSVVAEEPNQETGVYPVEVKEIPKGEQELIATAEAISGEKLNPEASNDKPKLGEPDGRRKMSEILSETELPTSMGPVEEANETDHEVAPAQETQEVDQTVGPVDVNTEQNEQALAVEEKVMKDDGTD